MQVLNSIWEAVDEIFKTSVKPAKWLLRHFPVFPFSRIFLKPNVAVILTLFASLFLFKLGLSLGLLIPQLVGSLLDIIFQSYKKTAEGETVGVFYSNLTNLTLLPAAFVGLATALIPISLYAASVVLGIAADISLAALDTAAIAVTSAAAIFIDALTVAAAAMLSLVSVVILTPLNVLMWLGNKIFADSQENVRDDRRIVLHINPEEQVAPQQSSTNNIASRLNMNLPPSYAEAVNSSSYVRENEEVVSLLPKGQQQNVQSPRFGH